MAVEKMKLVTVGGKMDSLDDFIVRCCLNGKVHVEPAINHLSHTLKFVSLTEENKYSDKLSMINEMADSFDAKLEMVDIGNYFNDDETVNEEYLEKLSNTIKTLQDKKAEKEQEKQSCELAIENLSHFLEVSIPLNDIIECQFTKFRFGHIPKANLDKLTILSDNPYLVFFPCSDEGEDVWGVYFAPLERKDEIDRIFASLYFERLIIPNSYDTPQKAIDGYKLQVKEIDGEIDKINEKLSLIWHDEEKSCDMLYTRFVIGNTIHLVRSNVAVYGESFCFIGWVPQSEYEAFRQQIETVDGIDWESDDTENIDKHDVPPTKLKNNKFFKPFEEFVKMYGVPNYKEFDPTAVFGIMYTIIFGIMFADVGQGFVVALGGFILGKVKHSDLGKIFGRCGISAMFFGTVFGSVFGFDNALDWLYKMMGMSQKPFSILESTLGVILMGIYMGVGLIYFFMCLNIYKSVKQKHFARAIFSESGLAGMVCYTGGVIWIAQFLNDKINILPTWVCFAMIGGALVLLFFKELAIHKLDKEPFEFDGTGDYIITNVVELLDYVISYFTNTLSFLRVGIFVLVHAVMMNVVFSLAPDPATNIVGYIITVVIGNIIVAALECLLTYIQVLRLGFYEMFSRFYEGDGTEFKAIHLLDKIKIKNK